MFCFYLTRPHQLHYSTVLHSSRLLQSTHKQHSTSELGNTKQSAFALRFQSRTPICVDLQPAQSGFFRSLGHYVIHRALDYNYNSHIGVIILLKCCSSGILYRHSGHENVPHLHMVHKHNTPNAAVEKLYYILCIFG